MNANNLQPISLIEGLMKPDAFNPSITQCVLIETHISWVIIAEPYAYKIKKSINLGFLDFSTLEKRLHFCNEELRLNKRLAPHIYLSVIPITGTVESPQWGGSGVPIEYAVKMIAFPQETQLDLLLNAGLLNPEKIDILARHIADFHSNIDRAGKDTDYGEPEVIYDPIEENFFQIRENIDDEKTIVFLTRLEKWSKKTFDAHHHLFTKRKANGFIRECHGDLHLRNIAWVDEQPVLFDCIEFSPHLRWIDVISDVGFLVMDLQDRRQPEFAQQVLNTYLEYTGDYAALHIIKFYIVYRALVRAKIDAIRANQEGINRQEKLEAEKDFDQYLDLALSYIEPSTPQIIITRGLSASGKSTISQTVLEHIGAIRIRSDVERKRLYGIKPDTTAKAAVDKGIYTREATEKTYQRLLDLTDQIIDAGYSVIIDGVFMHYQQRLFFKQLAEKKEVPFTILECTADIETLQKRIVERKSGTSDATLEVLDKQYAMWKPLRDDETSDTITVNTENPVNFPSLLMQIQKVKT